MRDRGPTIAVFNRQRVVAVQIAPLQEFAQRAFRECLKLPGRKSDGLSQFQELSIILVSDRRMAELHWRFLQQAGPTDVITFQHGEIFISTETARRQARSFRTSFEHEVRLYIAHGLLHLHGFDDKTPPAAARMRRTQEKVVAAALRGSG